MSTKEKLRDFLVSILARPFFRGLNTRFLLLSLNGLGILNYKSPEISGELSFLKKMVPALKSDSVILDVGANVGGYSNLIREYNKQVQIYAFEPHYKTFENLQKNAVKNQYKALNLACGEKRAKLELYDYEERDGSSHASLYKEAIVELRQSKIVSHAVDVIDLDSFLFERNIEKVSLLKLDVEGNEYRVLQGLKKAIDQGKIEVIHFEFNEMNIFSRVFFKDFQDLLKDYRLFRMLPNHLLPLDTYSPLLCEIFAYQNIVACHKNSHLNIL